MPVLTCYHPIGVSQEPIEPDRFYELPPRPEWLDGVPQLGVWQPVTKLPETWAARHFVEDFFDTGRYRVLEKRATKLRNGIKCELKRGDLNAGGQHVVMKIRFVDEVVWLARIRFPPCSILDHECVGGFTDYEAAATNMESEIATMAYIASKTRVPVPRVFGYNLFRDNDIGGPYMFMEMVEGDTLETCMRKQGGIWGSQVRHLLKQMVQMTFELSTIKFNGIGRLRFGNTPTSFNLVSYGHAPPYPPFDNVSQYLQSRINNNGPSIDSDRTVDRLGKGWVDADMRQKPIIAKSIYYRAAQHLMVDAQLGPFPLQHADLNQQNIIVDRNCNVLAIIDWEHAGSRPYEVVDIRLSKLFQQPWQPWESLHWVERYTGRLFSEMENRYRRPPQISTIVGSPLGRLGMILYAPVNLIQYFQQIGELIRILYRDFPSEVRRIVPLAIAKQILPTIFDDLTDVDESLGLIRSGGVRAASAVSVCLVRDGDLGTYKLSKRPPEPS
jgi:Phosphotransferase enzyme family